ncbi:MAG: MFS transporter, partial [Methyloceanibacter sp.]
MTQAKSKSRNERPQKKNTSDIPQKVAKSEVEQEILRPSIALIIAVVLTAILEVLDITIVSVSIPHMLGSFGATSDQITWVLTSYLVAAAVGMPLTGYLSERLGR